jgi:alpha-D-xyloside xylohydrolase
MKKYWILFIITLSGALLLSCTSGHYQKTDDGIVVTLKPSGTSGPQLVRLQVINANIIRVSATPRDNFIDRNSLAVLPGEGDKVPFVVTESRETVDLVTDSIIASVSLETGSVQFMDKLGNPILQELTEGGKTFTSITLDNSNGYTFRQVFESPDDEAFFGLGQHQSDEWNYKGKNEILYQYNTKVSIPFIISNRNYGILWDNYSLTKFGDPRDYLNLSQFKLYNRDGEEGGLTASYVQADGETFIERDEAEINYENLTDVKNFPEGFPFWQSEITWDGELEAAESGEYEFKLYYAGYTRVFMDGVEVVKERWRTAWNPNTYKFRIHLEAGKRVPVSIRWKPDGGISYLGLKAMGPLDPGKQGRLSLWSEMGQELDYYFIHGENMDRVISGYRTLTGKAPIMPQWAYGFWQSRERYKTQDEIVGTLAEFRRRRIPIDNIVQDWSYWKEDQWGSHEFDPSRFPDPQKMVDDIHDMNAHLMISVWPKFYINTEHYKELDAQGWMYQQAVKDSVRDWIGKGYIGSFYDAYAEGARKLFWEQMNEHLYSLGMDAWWMDASEPDILSNASLEYRKLLSGPTALGSSTEYLNAYALVNADAIYNGQRSVDPNKRVFLLTRSGFAGLQRYSTATWSGDIGTRWEDMKAQISAGLNYNLSGIPYWTMDIGGFCVEHRYENAREGSPDLEEWRELNTRWYQFGTFAPLFRVHGQYPLREIFNMAPESHPAYQSMLYYNKLRYKLMPYIYAQAAKVTFDDYTIMRALVMDFPDDPRTKDIGDQYMFGPSLMICPVYQYKAREREVIFPGAGSWYDLYSGKLISGNQRMNVPAPYERMPIFVKAGSIVPLGPEIQYVGEKPGAPVTLYIYGGDNATFTLYEDEGVNYNYEKGAYSKIRFNYNDASKTLQISDREGQYDGMTEKRLFNLVLITGDSPRPLDSLEAPDQSVIYEGKAMQLQF